MTYQELLEKLLRLNPSQLKMDVSILMDEERYAISGIVRTKFDDFYLKKYHPVIVIKGTVDGENYEEIL